MKHLALVAMLLGAAPALGEGGPTAAVQQGDTWAKLAQRHLGDAAFAAELRALNHAAAEPEAGGTIRLPGEERAKALTQVQAAREALAAPGAASHEGARSALHAAEAALIVAEYETALARSQEALALLHDASEKMELDAGKRTHFSVARTASGAEVVAEAGSPVEVTAGGSRVVIAPGEGASIGKTPEKVVLPAAPALVEPAEGALLKLPPPGKPELRDAAFRWASVPGATAYLLVVERAGKSVLREEIAASEVHVPLAKLGEGRLSWTVRALDAQHRRGAPSPARWIAVEVEPPSPTSLQVGKGRWE